MHRTWPFRPVLGVLLLGTAGLLASVAPACAPADDEALRRDVLAHLADDVFVPTTAKLRDEAAALPPAVRAACAAPSPDLDAAVDMAWRHTHNEWSVTAAFVIGPVVEQMQVGPLDFWPVRSDTVDDAVAAAPAAVDAAYVDSRGTSAKGLPALEYLLYADPAALTGTRCSYAAALADDIVERTAAIADAWPAQAEAFKSAGDSGSPYTSTQAAVDALVNATIENLYAMVKSKLDRPLGNLTGSPVDVSLVESRYSDNSLTDLRCNLDGFALVYLGADLKSGGAPGLGALVADRDPELDVRITDQLQIAGDALAAIPPPLSRALADDPSLVQTARDEIDTLRRYIKLDVAQLLNVTLSISDNDGD